MLRTEIRELIRESAPIAGILLFWLFFGKLVPIAMATRGALAIGVLMAILYVLVKGLELGESLELSVGAGGGTLFAANVTVVAAAGGWFVLGTLVWFVLNSFLLFRPPVEPLLAVHSVVEIFSDLLAFVFVGTGVLTACLYVVALGVARFGSRDRRAERSPTESVTE